MTTQAGGMWLRSMTEPRSHISYDEARRRGYLIGDIGVDFPCLALWGGNAFLRNVEPRIVNGVLFVDGLRGRSGRRASSATG